MDINFELYKIFYHVAKTMSFSEAAARLFISQPAVSQAVRQLEEKLSCRLFNRNTKQVALTREGAMLLPHVEQAVNFLQAGERMIDEMHSFQRGVVRIAASDTICKYYLLPFLQKFNRLYPKIKFSITNRTSPSCVELLQKGAVDVSIINIPRTHNYKGMSLTSLQTIQDVFIAGHSYGNLNGRPVPPGELAQFPLLILEKNTVTREFFDDFAASCGLTAAPVIELGSIDLLVEMAKNGLGISFVPSDCIQRELASGEIFILDVPGRMPSRELGVITRDNTPIPVAAQQFIAMLTKASPDGINDREQPPSPVC